MLLTIALLTKNSEDTVWYTLKSILRQDIPPSITLELVVIDGYSADNTLKIVENAISRLRMKFGHRLMRHVIRQEGVGVGYARNLALRETSGDWVLWVDSDNVLAQDYISKAVEEIEECKDTNTAVLYPRRVVTMRRDNSLASKLITCYGFSQLHTSKGLKSLIEKLMREEPTQKSLPYTAMQGSLCKSNVLRGIGGFNNHLLAAEDIDIYLRLLNHGYSMQPFNSTLYSFSRKTLSAWFKQAVLWGYGKELLMQTYESNLSRSWKTKNYMPVISNLAYTLIVMQSLLMKGVSVCGALGLLTPLTYIYRRIGYIKGYLCALEHYQKRIRKKKYSF